MVSRDRGWMLTNCGALAWLGCPPRTNAVLFGAPYEWAAFSGVTVVCLDWERYPQGELQGAEQATIFR